MKSLLPAAMAWLLLASPILAHDIDVPGPVVAFEKRFGFKSVFWCAEVMDGHAAALARAASAGKSVPAIAFDSASYCMARHFPTRDAAECGEALHAIVQLDLLYPGFSEGEIALGVMGACNVYVTR